MMKKDSIRWEKVSKCYLCNSLKIKLFLKDVRYWEYDYSFNLFKCQKCNFIFINPRPKQKYINNFYKSESYWGQNLDNANNVKQDGEKIYKDIYALISLKEKSSIFDIGAGTGLFLSKFKELGWKVGGVEYSKDAVKFAKKTYNLNLMTGDLLSAKIKREKYDYIVINNVLEHLYDPLRTLIKANSMQVKGGEIIVAVPNIDSLGFKIFRRIWYPLQPPIHLSQFSPDTIELILNKSGYKIIKIIHKNPEHAIFSIFESFRSLITGRNKKEGDPKISKKIKKTSNTKNNKSLIKNVIADFIYLISVVIYYVGGSLKKGENIIIYAEKK